MSSLQSGNGAVHAIIFDLDGVIVDSHPIHKKAWRRFLSGLGRKVTDKELDFVLDGRKREDILSYFLGELTAEQVRNYGHEKDLLFRQEVLAINVCEGLRELLPELERDGIRMAVASSGSKGRVHFVLEHVGLKDFFSVVITGDEVTRGKPDPTIFLRAAERLAVPPERTLVVEDAVSGVRAAKTAGMRCLGIAEGHRVELLRVAGADRVLPNFVGLTVAELHGLIARDISVGHAAD